ncbi:sigma-70 family RNA polymerase sigma factor [Streptomyces sp. NBC_01283]|uniref:sigma-70 family RNA polymerase sigma factor n=1 Tax=Streptomyces sp. NBC_01283 TaxID=2903812 RepID=UPI00352F04E5|nr:sigma-70 family RNA polymerase sigma factor [Streptomyces sp. NBC_01283]
MIGDHDPLVTAAQTGDQQAQDELVAGYLPLVYNIVGRALDGHADVDDVVQETMLRALAGLATLRDPASFRSWLVAIAMNEIRRHWQQRASGQKSPGPLDEAHDVADPGADFVDLTIIRLGLVGQRREVAEATRWLDTDDRALLSLWWLEVSGELTRAEVATAMELPAQHAAVRVQRMKTQLETARIVVRALAAAPRCPYLSDVVAPWDGTPSALWRKRLARHVRDCAMCSDHGAGLVLAERLLVGLALVPLSAALAAPGAIRAVSAADAHHLAADAPHLSAGGHPTAPDAYEISGSRSAPARHAAKRHRVPRKSRTVAAGVAVLVVATGVIYSATRPSDDEQTEAQTLTASQPPSPQAPSTTASAPTKSPSASPSRKRKPSPKATPSKTRAPKPKATPKPTRTSTAPKAPQAPQAPAGNSYSAEVTRLVNAERAKSGCGPLTLNSKLGNAAQGHSDDMAERDFFDHTNPDGEDPGDRVTAAGYKWTTYGENIAAGQRSPSAVMDSWMNSSGHRANILNCSFKEIGVGYRQGSGGPWWTQNFGAR